MSEVSSILEAFPSIQPGQTLERAQPSTPRNVPSAAILALLDVVTVEFSVLLAAALVARLGGTDWSLDARDLTLATIIAPATLVLVNLQLGLYNVVGQGTFKRFRLRAQGTLLMPWPAMAVIAIGWGKAAPTASTLGLAWIILVILGFVADKLARLTLLKLGAWGERAVLIGSSEATDRLASHLLDHPELGLRPIGRFSDAPSRHDSRLPCLGTLLDVDNFAGGAAVAVVSISPGMPLVEPARLPFSRVIVVPDVSGAPSGWGSASGLGEALGFAFANRTESLAENRIKRILDLGIATIALIIASPTIGLLAALIKIVSPGPAFYKQNRVGLGGQPVAILKLRSMYMDAELRLQDLLVRDDAARDEWERYMKLSQDPRVLPILGNFLRRTSLDELPQLWNVIRGDISLVGPRPFPAYHVSRFDPAFQKLRARVKPGLTGLWQVTERSNADLGRQEAIDTFYIRNWSLWLDLYILVRTLPALVSTRGAR